jgi:hypothetical protein
MIETLIIDTVLALWTALDINVTLSANCIFSKWRTFLRNSEFNEWVSIRKYNNKLWFVENR